MEKIEKLTPDIVEQCKVGLLLERSIRKRITYILHFIVEAVNKGNITWFKFGTGSLPDDNFYINSCGEDRIFITSDCSNPSNLAFIDKNKCIWMLENCIPMRWLWEDFEDEYKDGKQKYLDRMKENQERRLKKK